MAARVNRLIAVTITGVALYDQDANKNSGRDPGIQANENLAIGILYRFP
jgi:hypothetical protein